MKLRERHSSLMVFAMLWNIGIVPVGLIWDKSLFIGSISNSTGIELSIEQAHKHKIFNKNSVIN